MSREVGSAAAAPRRSLETIIGELPVAARESLVRLRLTAARVHTWANLATSRDDLVPFALQIETNAEVDVFEEFVDTLWETVLAARPSADVAHFARLAVDPVVRAGSFMRSGEAVELAERSLAIEQAKAITVARSLERSAVFRSRRNRKLEAVPDDVGDRDRLVSKIEERVIDGLASGWPCSFIFRHRLCSGTRSPATWRSFCWGLSDAAGAQL